MAPTASPSRPRFNTNCLSLVDRGFVYAIAHIRGGKDKGYAWYEDGKREKKTNTFTDFIAAARHLVRPKASPRHDRIVAQGGSAGGMLMGAIANMAPEAVRRHHRRSALRRRAHHHARRHAAADAAGMAGMGQSDRLGQRTTTRSPPIRPTTMSAPMPYPPILAVAGLTDPRVTYWEPAKWVARLRERKTGDNPVLLKTNMDAGHAGASGRFSRLEEVAFNYAFALKVAGQDEAVSLIPGAPRAVNNRDASAP